MRRAAKVDRNHAEVVAALEAMGWGVISTAQLGKGFPDLVAMKAGRIVFIEVKNPQRMTKAGKPWDRNDGQVAAHQQFARYGVHVHVICRVGDLVQLDRDARQKFEGVPSREFYPEVPR